MSEQAERKSPVIQCPGCRKMIATERYTKCAVIHEYFCPWCNEYIGGYKAQEQRSNASKEK